MTLKTHPTDVGTIGIAHQAYKEYCKTMGYIIVPCFDDLNERDKNAWLAAVDKVIDITVNTMVKV